MAQLLDRVRGFLNPPKVTTPKRRIQRPLTPPAGVSDGEWDQHALTIRNAIRASYDSVQRTPENWRHWQWADNRSADSSLNPAVRIAIRSQARYECHENNSYGRGLVETLVTDTIGAGPRLQMSQFRHSVNQEIEAAWERWAEASDLCGNLEVIRSSKGVDGESVIRFINNIMLEDMVQLDLQLIECDQLRSPQFELETSEFYVDGVHLDRFGNPYAYDILRQHPGADTLYSRGALDYDRYGIAQVIHAFSATRAGQHRGISEFAPALPLFAFLRRFTLATVSAAETAANVSQVVETDAPIPEELEEEYAVASFSKWLDTIPIDRNSATVLPNMWKLRQFAAEHPGTTYRMFKREIISEISRCLCIPISVAAADSGESNFSSTKFDWLGYERKIQREQQYFNRRILNRILAEWLIEASLVGAIPKTAANYILGLLDSRGSRGFLGFVKHTWHWGTLRDSDDKDAANAQKIRLQNGSTHRAREYASQGLDIEVEDAKAAESFGISVEEYRKLLMVNIFANGNLLPGEADSDSDSDSDSNSDSDDSNESSDETQTQSQQA